MNTQATIDTAAVAPLNFDPNAWHHSQMTTLEAIELSRSGGHPYSSPNVPKGFNTVVGFFFDTYDWYPAAYDDEEGNAMKDRELIQYEDWCAKYARKLGLEVKEVEAPAALKVHGIMALKAYPEALLEIRLIEMP
ncbi:hypothetical protein ELZ22_05610 [Brucella abortus]|uniref:hypothetical protein n=1 Tax=Brucella abortus TaxID=235 RepID=UPI000F8F12EB|nr:hypothetical protein [Brucella abortus]RUQ83076.1 hypothetical protein ELZ22_05610 [Brucella abortus]